MPNFIKIITFNQINIIPQYGYPFIPFQDTAEYTLCLILGVPATSPPDNILPLDDTNDECIGIREGGVILCIANFIVFHLYPSVIAGNPLKTILFRKA